MTMLVRSEAEFGLYVEAPCWYQGQEGMAHHAVRAVDPALVDEVLAARRSPKKLARFLLDRGATYWKDALDRRTTLPADELADLQARITALLPEQEAGLRRLDADAVPALALRRVRARLTELERYVGWGAPDLVLANEKRKLAVYVGPLIAPDRTGYAAEFDGPRGAVEEAVMLLGALGGPEVGLGDAIADLTDGDRKLLVPKTRDTLPALDGGSLAVLRPDEIGPYVDRVGALAPRFDPDDDEAPARLAELTAELAVRHRTWLVGVSKWHDFASGGGRQPDA